MSCRSFRFRCINSGLVRITKAADTVVLDHFEDDDDVGILPPCLRLEFDAAEFDAKVRSFAAGADRVSISEPGRTLIITRVMRPGEVNILARETMTESGSHMECVVDDIGLLLS